MHTADIETIVVELCAHEPAFAGREEEVRELVRALREARPQMTLDAQFVAELRRKVLAQAPTSSMAGAYAAPSPYASYSFDWTAWIARLAPVSVIAVFFFVLAGNYHPQMDTARGPQAQFVYPRAASSGTDSAQRAEGGMGVHDAIRVQPAATDPGYGGSADIYMKGGAVQPRYTGDPLPPEMSSEPAGIDVDRATSSEGTTSDSPESSVIQIAPQGSVPLGRPLLMPEL